MTEPIKTRYTWLIEYATPSDAPAAHAHMQALGGEVVAVQFSDALGDLSRAEAKADEIHTWYDVALERAEKAEAEIERLRADAERYRHLCEYQRWAPEIEAAFDCSPKVLIDEAIDNSIKAMKEPK